MSVHDSDRESLSCNGCGAERSLALLDRDETCQKVFCRECTVKHSPTAGTCRHCKKPVDVAVQLGKKFHRSTTSVHAGAMVFSHA